MAQAVALRSALRNIGFSQDASTYIVDTQGFDTAEDYAMLTDDEAMNVCKITRRPGGTDANGDANAGIMVSLKAENNLKLLCFYFRYRERTSRPLTVNLATQETIRGYAARAHLEDAASDPEPPELTFKNWTRTVDVIEEYLRNCLGTTKIPLAYVIREAIDPKADADDPAAGYSNLTDELIARAPHYQAAVGNAARAHTQAYKDDNILVYNKLAALLRDKDCWTYMQVAARSRDGRRAFLCLKGHYLGRNNVDNLANQAERKLNSTTYTGEGRRWNFEKYVKTHVEQHQILQDLTRHGYAGIDPRSKVRHLLEGIKTTSLDTVKAQILADANMRSDFDACVNLFQDFIKQSASEPRHANISAMNVGSRGHGPSNPSKSNSKTKTDYDNLQPDMSVEDRYYSREEYETLSPSKKKGLSIKRNNRGHKPGQKSSKTVPKKGKTTYQKPKRNISAIHRLEEGDESEDDEEIPMKGANGDENSNRTNKALVRKAT